MAGTGASVGLLVLAGLLVAGLAAYTVVWRWLGASPDRRGWLRIWVIAHGLAVLTLIYLRATSARVALLLSQGDGRPSVLRELMQEFTPIGAVVVAGATFISAVALCALILALLDGLRRLAFPARPRRPERPPLH